MPELPTGTVTFLFSDIEGSTRMARALGDAWPGELDQHRRIVRTVVAASGGVEVGTEGDSFFVAFSSAIAAVEAAVAIQRGLVAAAWHGEPVRVRIGLHTGEAEVRDGTYVGVEVHRAARIANAGNGGQVLLSRATRGLVGGALPPGVELTNLGAHRLPDLPGPEPLFALAADGLEGSARPIRTLETPTNLPGKLTTFLGREREIGEVSDHLSTARLLTLTGPGGTGKTRLSIQVASRLVERYPDGVYFVDLSSITQPGLVPATIARELGLPDRGGRDPMERLAERLRSRRVLVVLDNFEQVLEAAGVVRELLEVAPQLAVLVTSRSALRIYGEQEYPVPPLPVPDPAHLPPLEVLSQYEAVALFLARAMAVRPDFRITNENAPAVAEICVRLDGLPLAIELAAARIRVLTPQAMLARLEHRLGLLSSGSRDLPERQQTLRGAIGWSYDLLEEGERILFACLSVFVGGAALDQMETLARDRVRGDVLDTLGSLVDKSLVRQVEDARGLPRLFMLETIREFAIERLESSDIADEVRARHADQFLALAEEAQPHLTAADSGSRLDLLEEEHGNLRAALAWFIDRSAPERALRLTASLWRFWQRRGYLAEGLEWTERAIALPRALEHPACIGPAMEAAGGLAYWLGNQPSAKQWYERWLEHTREQGDRGAEADALYSLSFAYQYAPDVTAESLVQARSVTEAALAIYRERGNRHGEGLALWGLANVWYSLGRETQATARGYVEQALAIFREVDDMFMAGWARYTMGVSYLVDGNADQALPHLREAMEIFVDADDVSGYTLVFDAIGLAMLFRGERLRAARFGGAVAALERTTGTGLNARNRELLHYDSRELRDAPDTAEAWAEGESTPLEELVREALEI